jgi:hypothetical protein
VSVTADDALAAVRIAKAAKRSMTENRPITIASEDEAAGGSR